MGHITRIIFAGIFLCNFYGLSFAVTWGSFTLADIVSQNQIQPLSSNTENTASTTGPGGEDPTQGVYFLEPSNTGAVTTTIPIEVPPGRGSVAPKLALTYSSNRGNGVVGMGWDISMGAIARSTKRGVDYIGKDFVFINNGGSTELAQRPDRGSGYFSEAVERSFSRYYYDSTYDNSNGRWIVTTKDGTKNRMSILQNAFFSLRALCKVF